MKEIIKTIKIYEFKELKKETQNKIIENYINYLLSIIDIDAINKNSNFYKAIAEAEKMQTPWFAGQYVWEYCKNQILKDVKSKEYYENGEIYGEE